MRVLDVSDLTLYLKSLLEDDPILSDLWVRGEVTNLSRSSAGHYYFGLGGDGMHLQCVLFRGNQRGLLAEPRSGEAVLAHGRVSVYEARGQYQLVVDNVAPEGMGILQLEFEETKRRLAADGLFALERKRLVPEMPRYIGVVTSASGAVWHDIQTIVARRFPLVELILAPSSVQGFGAVDELLAALRLLQDDGRSDVIILARGGGSAEDLACFNDERLARAIFACRVPVVSAIGHETDVTIADMVADLRASTPSAAAELCVPNARELLDAVREHLATARSRAAETLSRAGHDLALVTAHARRHDPSDRIEQFREMVIHARAHADERITQRLIDERRTLHELRARATLLDPRDVLRRGYAIVSTIDGGDERRVPAARVARAQDHLRLTFADGALDVTTTKEYR